MTDFSNDQVYVATLAFMNAMRRAQVKLQGHTNIRPIEELPAAHRAALIASMKVALKAADPANVARVLANQEPVRETG